MNSTTSKLKKIEIVADYFRSLTSEVDLKIAATFLSGRIFPPGLESLEINVGHSLIWKSLSSFHSLKEEELSKHYMKHGDLGSAIEDYLNSKGIEGKPSPTLFLQTDSSLQGVHSTFKELARTSGKGSSDRKRRIIERLFSTLKKQVEAKYLVRIMSRELRIGLVVGLLEESISKAFSKKLEEVRSANLVTGDIGSVAVLAKLDELQKAELWLFRPTNFMLADTAPNAEALFQRFKVRPLIADYKYDGIRAQIHSEDGRAKIFSRNLEDITEYFPELETASKKLGYSGIILDGEIIAFKESKPLSFQALQQRLRKLERPEDEVPVKFFAFDILYMKQSMIKQRLSERISTLRSLKLSGVMGYSEQRLVSTPEEIQSMFEESKSLGYEGLVVKSPMSLYTPGRRGKNWVKLKKELDTLDVAIVAAEYGHGKRAGLISDCTFAVRDCHDLRVIGKAYSGLTDEEILEMTNLLKEITIEDQGHRRIVKPQVILEVAFDAVQRSNRHNSGYALRFPRIKRVRSDKSLEQVDTLEKVKRIYKAQTIKY